MKINTVLTERIFRRFTIFDTVLRKKIWRGPALFALVLTICAGACFYMHRVRGAAMLGGVLLAVGLGVPLVYFGTFFHSVSRQVQELGLKRPRPVYSLELTDQPLGILVSNEQETARYRWDSVYHAYRDADATYLYITPERALILPHSCVENQDAAALWALLIACLPAERCTVL